MENINDIITEDIFLVLKNIVNNVESNFAKKVYIATVVDNKDPDGEGKVQIKPHGLFDDIKEKDLPWAVYETQYTDVENIKITIPKIGSKVKVYFDNDDLYKPIYNLNVPTFASINSKVKGAGSNPDIYVLYENEQGDYISIDTANSVFTINHNKGTVLTIDTDGFVHLTQTNPNTKLTVGTLDIDDKGFNVVRYDSIGLKKTNVSANNDGTVEIKNAGTAGLGSGGISVAANGMLSVNDGMATPNPLGPFCAIPVCPISGGVHTGAMAAPGLSSPGAI